MLKKIIIFAAVLGLYSCKVTRRISTDAIQVYAGDTIKTNTIFIESYDGKKNIIN